MGAVQPLTTRKLGCLQAYFRAPIADTGGAPRLVLHHDSPVSANILGDETCLRNEVGLVGMTIPLADLPVTLDRSEPYRISPRQPDLKDIDSCV